MADILSTKGADMKYGRGNMHSSNKVGNEKLKAPVSTRTSDQRDMGGANLPIHVTRETPAAKPGKGGHDAGLLGG